MKTNKAHQLLENVLVDVASNWCFKAGVKHVEDRSQIRSTP